MKKLTKVLSLVLALALAVMSVNIVAVNANDNINNKKIIIDGVKDGETFTAYQILHHQ